jgi:hypothetical protein
MTNVAYNNPNVKGLVYVAAAAPMEGQSLTDIGTIDMVTKVLDLS